MRKKNDFGSLGSFPRYRSRVQRYNLVAAWRLVCAGFRCFPDLPTEEYHRLRLRKAFLAFLQGSEKELADLAPQYMVESYDKFPLLQAEACGYSGIYLQHNGNPEGALACYLRALRIRAGLKDKIGLLQLRINLGTCLRDLQEFAKAEKVLTAVQNKLGNDKANRHLYLCCCLEKGRLAYRNDDTAVAIELLEFTLDISDIKHYPDVCADCFRELARIYWDFRYHDRSREHYFKALRLYVKQGFAGKAKSLREEFADRF
jgi:tetratricopeptide (TPR) repeat protein